MNLVFTNNSRVITTSSVIDFKTILKPRDWIRSDLITEPTWYEILEVLEQQITLRVIFGGASATKAGRYKAIEYIDENSLVTVNCLGKEDDSGIWRKTASDAVRDLIIYDAGFGVVNEVKFATAKTDCPYILSLIIPETLGSSAPTVRDTITKIILQSNRIA